MENQGPLHLKYRPGKFEEFVGNESTVTSLKSVLGRKQGQVKTFLFSGPSGCGKTTLARIVASELGCSENDFHEYNVANTRGIDTIREIIQNCRYAPLSGDLRIYLLDEAHKLTGDAQNALLKVLEDTPDHARFILCTTEVDKVIATIRNRATAFPVQPLTRQAIIRLLKDVTLKEGVGLLPDSHYLEISNCAEGSPRKALTILDSVIDIEDLDQMLTAIVASSVGEKDVKDITAYLMNPGGKNWKGMSTIIKGMDLSGDRPENVRRALKSYFGSVLLNKGDDRSFDLMSLFLEPYYSSGREGLIASLFLACKL